jgi:hypothetical protein
MSGPNLLTTERCRSTGRQRHVAARAAAAGAHDPADLAVLLDMLGLCVQDGKVEPIDPEPPEDTDELDRHREVGAELALSMLGAVRRNRAG